MPFVLRKVEKVRWDKDQLYADYPWLLDNEIPIPAECLMDIAAKGNELSLWYIESENDPNLPQVCAALSATRNNIKHFEYALFDISVIENADFVLHETPGQTPDASIAHLHRDVRQLTADKVLSFLVAVWDNARTGSILKKDIEYSLQEGLRLGRLNRKIMDKDLVNRLEK